MNRAALSPSSLWSMTRESISAWIDDFAPSMGAAIAYYTMFSIAPLLLIVIAIAGFVFGEEAASGQIYAQIAGLVGPQGADAVQELVKSASDPAEGIIATVVGIVTLIIGATTVFAELQSDLDRIWKAPAAKKTEGLWGLIRSRVLSLGLVVSMGFVMLVSLVVSAGLAALGSWWDGVFGNWVWVLQVVNFLVSFGVITAMFALMYKILPRVSIGWHDVWIGAAATAVLFTLGKLLVGLYLGKSSVASSFGAAGSLAVLLVWVYYSAQIFLLGAEFTWVYAHRFGSRVGQDMPATAKEQGASGKPAEDGGGAKDRPRDSTEEGPSTAATARHARDAKVAVAAGRMGVTAASTFAAPSRPRATRLAQRHTGILTAVALVAGALASEALRLGQRRLQPRPLRRLAGELSHLRADPPRRRESRLTRWLRA